MTSRRRTGLLVAAVVVLLVIAGVGGYAYARWAGAADEASAGPSRPAAARPTPLAALTTDAPTPGADGLAAALAPALANPDLGVLTGQITDAATGDVLWRRDADVAQTPGSVTKVLTAAAALLVLSPAHRIPTTVVPGAAPGELVLVGGGDPTLTAQPAGEDGYYTDAPRLDDLVEQIVASGIPVRSLLVDDSLFGQPSMAEGWLTVDIAGGSIAPIESVMLDGGRQPPLVDYSPRTATPALDAGRTLAQRLGLDPGTVALGTAPTTAEPIATVWSAPLSVRLHQMMVQSDDVTAETIGREIARAAGKPATFEGTVAAVTDAVSASGIDVSGLVLRDASGLSTEDRIPARLLDDVLTAATGDGDAADELRPLVDDLAVGGGSGTLWDRFVSPSPGAGWVRAKTGTLDFVNALAGIVTDVDGRALTFTLMSTGTPSAVAKPALDAVAVTLRECGCRQ
ncbi:D-alanyl-D-alanine carboxypeptidase/D-alanyl-D-alanine endopeptidase [Mycolicibacterium grossiae]|nr:D-alanyl-D-alanine carboxypeptidase/D-alanyl-D-alanine-endopeptidase [Mycolicibacterium grossiae]QEM46980.1 D-alanyl-D-alanine carboxypeptidase/D-alanyl-D-alanine-endopeptidase [Mycolicibacterium grossiae]